MKRLILCLVVTASLLCCGFNFSTKEYLTKEDLKEILAEYSRIEYILPENRGFKSFMDYRTITDETSKQYSLQQISYTDYRGLRMLNNRYCVAIGTFFGTEVGQYLDVQLENGVILNCIVSEIKADKDTDEDNIFTTANGCCLEFLVDRDVLNNYVNRKGDMSNLYLNWGSPVYSFVVYDVGISTDLSTYEW